jgi:hypothetical protein
MQVYDSYYHQDCDKYDVEITSPLTRTALLFNLLKRLSNAEYLHSTHIDATHSCITHSTSSDGQIKTGTSLLMHDLVWHT